MRGTKVRILAAWFSAVTTMAGAACMAAPEPPPAVREGEPPRAAWWPVRPWHTEPKILKWAADHPDLVSLDRIKTFGGRTAYAVTVTGPGDAAKKTGLLLAQPHAHEPAATAGMMDLLSQLIEGRRLDGKPADPRREQWLQRCLFTFIPDGNPDGRARAPEDWWDGTHTNVDFLDWAFGRLPDGKRCARVGRWSLADRKPAWIGFVYEQLNPEEFVEPNRDVGSTYFRLILRAHQRHTYAVQVDLHQTEFERSSSDSMIILPFAQNELPQPLAGLNQRLGRTVVDAWRRAGAHPVEKVERLRYGEDQLRYFRKCWGDLLRQRANITFEIQNNNRRTPPLRQMELMEIGIRAVTEFMLSQDAR